MIFRHTIISTGDELSDCRQKRPSSACFLFLYKPGCGFSLAPLIFSTELFSWTFLAYSLLTFFITALIVFLLFPTARETFLASSATARRTVIISSFLLSLLLLFNMPLQPFHAISAMVRLAIYGAVGFDSGIGSIEFLYLGDSLGYIPYKDLVISGDYQIHEDSIRFNTEEAFSIHWEGRLGNLLEFAFKPTSAVYQTEVVIDKQIEELDLFRWKVGLNMIVASLGIFHI